MDYLDATTGNVNSYGNNTIFYCVDSAAPYRASTKSITSVPVYALSNPTCKMAQWNRESVNTCYHRGHCHSKQTGFI